MLSATDAIAVTGALCRELGAPAAATLVADRSNLVLRLDPTAGAPFIARVAMATSLVRVGLAWLAREVAITRYLAARGEDVTRPTTMPPAGPHERGGLVISFWELEALTGGLPDPRAAGRGLARVHAALRDYPAADLPEWGAHHEARAIAERVRQSPWLDQDQHDRVARAWGIAERIVDGARARSASFQAVHGDAHNRNVLATARGAVWTDWEDAFVGPVEFDIACLRSKADLLGEDREPIDTMLAAYCEAGGRYDPALAAELQLVRNLQVIAWTTVFAERDPSLVPRIHARIERLPPEVSLRPVAGGAARRARSRRRPRR